jgi:GNAT superfamily N-acetyltransferase
MTSAIDIAIGPGTVAEASVIAAVHAEAAVLAFSGIFPDASITPTASSLEPGWAELLDDTAAEVLVARSSSDIVGMVAVRPDTSVPSGLLLARLYVRPDHWNRGIGSRLHDHAMERARGRGARAMNLWVLEENHRGRQMYEARGWQMIAGRYLLNEPPEVRDVLYERTIA